MSEFARDCDIFVERVPSKVDDLTIVGNEHIVDLRVNEQGRVQKYTIPGRPAAFTLIFDELNRPVRLRAAYPSEYLERLILQNEIFGDKIRLEKFFRVENRFQISQPYRDGVHPPVDSIRNHLSNEGFLLMETAAGDPYFIHKNLGIVVADTKPENWMMDQNHNIVPIDLVIARIPENISATSD